MIGLCVIILLVVLIIYGVYLLKNKNEKFEITYPTKTGIIQKLYLNPPKTITDKLGIETIPATVKFKCENEECNLESIESFVSSPTPSNNDVIKQYVIQIEGLIDNIGSNVSYIKQKLDILTNNYNNFIGSTNKLLEFQNTEVNKLKDKINYKEGFESIPLPTIKINKKKIYDKLNFISVK
jgi:hypothetical protein